MVTVLVLLKLAGGDCVNDLNILEADIGLYEILRKTETHGLRRKIHRALKRRWRKEKKRSVPSPSAAFRYRGMRQVVPIFTLNFLINQLQLSKAASVRIQEILDIRPCLGDRPGIKDLEGDPAVIRFEDIRFRYPKGSRLFSGLSFTISKGDLSALSACDRILVMEAGKLVQQGRHSDLISTPGVYQNLWSALQKEAPGGELYEPGWVHEPERV